MSRNNSPGFIEYSSGTFSASSSSTTLLIA